MQSDDDGGVGKSPGIRGGGLRKGKTLKGLIRRKGSPRRLRDTQILSDEESKYFSEEDKNAMSGGTEDKYGPTSKNHQLDDKTGRSRRSHSLDLLENGEECAIVERDTEESTKSKQLRVYPQANKDVRNIVRSRLQPVSTFAQDGLVRMRAPLHDSSTDDDDYNINDTRGRGGDGTTANIDEQNQESLHSKSAQQQPLSAPSNRVKGKTPLIIISQNSMPTHLGSNMPSLSGTYSMELPQTESPISEIFSNVLDHPFVHSPVSSAPEATPFNPNLKTDHQDLVEEFEQLMGHPQINDVLNARSMKETAVALEALQTISDKISKLLQWPPQTDLTHKMTVDDLLVKVVPEKQGGLNELTAPEIQASLAFKRIKEMISNRESSAERAKADLMAIASSQKALVSVFL